MIVVLDTNVWVSAFLAPKSPPGRVFAAIQMGMLEVVSSPKLWDELSRAVNYERVRKLFERDGLSEDVQRFLRNHPKVKLVDDQAPATNWVKEDPDDDWVVACAINAHADRIVTGDKALRAVCGVEGVRIVTARELVEEIGSEIL